MNKHGFSNLEEDFRKLIGLIGIWVFGCFNSYSRGSAKVNRLEKLYKSATNLANQVSELDVRTMRLLELKADFGENKLDLKMLGIQLPQLSKSTEAMLHSIEQKPSGLSRKRQATDYIVGERYSMFRESTGKTGKYTRDAYANDERPKYSGNFFFALKDFYEILC